MVHNSHSSPTRTSLAEWPWAGQQWPVGIYKSRSGDCLPLLPFSLVNVLEVSNATAWQKKATINPKYFYSFSNSGNKVASLKKLWGDTIAEITAYRMASPGQWPDSTYSSGSQMFILRLWALSARDSLWQFSRKGDLAWERSKLPSGCREFQYAVGTETIKKVGSMKCEI